VDGSKKRESEEAHPPRSGSRCWHHRSKKKEASNTRIILQFAISGLCTAEPVRCAPHSTGIPPAKRVEVIRENNLQESAKKKKTKKNDTTQNLVPRSVDLLRALRVYETEKDTHHKYNKVTPICGKRCHDGRLGCLKGIRKKKKYRFRVSHAFVLLTIIKFLAQRWL
jgi:hypothetical protein